MQKSFKKLSNKTLTPVLTEGKTQGAMRTHKHPENIPPAPAPAPVPMGRAVIGETDPEELYIPAGAKLDHPPMPQNRAILFSVSPFVSMQ